MKRIILSLVAVVVISGLGYAGWLYGEATEFRHQRLTKDVHVIFGFGGNVAVLRTGIGTVLVDTMGFAFQGRRIKALAEDITGKPVIMAINTHYHLDHSHGNPGLPEGTRIVATNNTRKHMVTVDADFWEDVEEYLPNETFEHEHRIEIGGKTIDLINPGRGHTDGDAVVLFVEDRIAHFGDLLFHRRYPNIDLEAGGTIEQWPITLDRVVDLEFDRIIPGHGDVTDRKGVAGFRAFLTELWQAGRHAADNGWSLAQTLADTELTKDAGMQAIRVPFILRLDRDFVVKRAWEEATGALAGS